MKLCKEHTISQRWRAWQVDIVSHAECAACEDERGW
jgi:hypothetical protein